MKRIFMARGAAPNVLVRVAVFGVFLVPADANADLRMLNKNMLCRLTIRLGGDW
jgi:hypothetical protein